MTYFQIHCHLVTNWRWKSIFKNRLRNLLNKGALNKSVGDISTPYTICYVSQWILNRFELIILQMKAWTVPFTIIKKFLALWPLWGGSGLLNNFVGDFKKSIFIPNLWLNGNEFENELQSDPLIWNVKITMVLFHISEHFIYPNKAFMGTLMKTTAYIIMPSQLHQLQCIKLMLHQ